MVGFREFPGPCNLFCGILAAENPCFFFSPKDRWICPMKRGFPVEFMCPFANSYTLASSSSINMAKITIAKMGTEIHAKWPASLAGFHPDHLHTDWSSEVCATWQDKTTWIGCLWSEDWGVETGLRYTCIVSYCIRIYTNLNLILIIPSISKQFRHHPSMESILCEPWCNPNQHSSSTGPDWGCWW